MIETMIGNHEIINFTNRSLIKFYDNTDNECYPLHWHNSIEIIMPLENSYTVISNDVAYHLRTGDILVMQPNVIHRMPAIPGRRFICQASLLPLYSQKMYHTLVSSLPATLLLTPERNEGLRAGVQELLNGIFGKYNTISQNAELSIYVGVLQILLLIGNSCQENPDCRGGRDIDQQVHSSNFLAICEYINNHYSDKLTLEEVAQKSGYSKYHFERLFKKFTNETFYQYLNRARIRNAEMLIREFDVSITEAAYKSGFSTISSFIRMFKIHNNCTPSEFRSVHAVK